MIKNDKNKIHEKFFNLSVDLLCVINSDGFFETVNSAFSHVLGYSHKEILATPVIDFIHPDDIDITLQEFGSLQAGQQLLLFENRFKHNNNQYVTLSWNGYKDHETGFIYAVGRDVTEQIDIKNKLGQLQHALEQETIYAETNIKGIITKVNQKFCDISGYSEQELLGQSHKLINSGHHPRAFFTDIWKRISSGKIWSGAIKNKRKDGSFYFVQSILLPIFGHNNKIARYVAIRQDITDKVNSENDRLKALAILSETSSAAKVGGWEMDVPTGTLSWTDETFRILEVTKVDGFTPMLPEGIQLFIEKDQPIIEKAVSRLVEFGEPYSLELQACTAKGNVKWVYTNGKAHYKNGKVESISGIIQDIHQRKLAEIKYNQERQKSVINAKFAALGELSASIAHEINNPLGVISGYAELLKIKSNTISPDELEHKSSILIKSCDRISHIVKSLKRFSRSDEKSEFKHYPLKNLVQEAITLTTPKIKINQVKLTHKQLDQCAIYCNEIEVEQVIVNLINNAVDAITTLSDKWVDISIRELPQFVQLSVTDSGDGIPEAAQDSIFEPFYTTKAVNEGTGLGLSIVKGILDKHRATISIDNQCLNTRFDIYFPKEV